jgi:hypothetical protein
LALVLDPSSPSLKWVQSGSTDQTLAVFRLNATDEDVRVDTVGLQIATTSDPGQVMASNTPQDLAKVTLWVGSTKVGETVFTANDYATATLSGVTVPKDGQLLLTVKGDIGSIAIGGPARPGHLVLVNYDASASSDETNTGAVGVGMSSGVTVGSGGSDTASNGARIARGIPTLEKIALSSSELTLGDGSGKTLYKFKVSAPSGTNGVSLYKFTFDVATSSSHADVTTGKALSTYRITDFEVFCYSDGSFINASCGSFDNSGRLNQGGLAQATVEKDDDTSTSGLNVAANTVPTQLDITFNPTDSAGGSTAEAIRVPAGETRWFVLRGTVTGSASTSALNAVVRLEGDATFASLNNAAGSSAGTSNDLTAVGDNWTTGRYIFATTASLVDAWDDDDFIWSGNSTNTTQSINDYDWFNGFLVPGLPTGGTLTETLKN